MTISDLEVRLRRAIEDEDDLTAAELAMALSELLGERDTMPDPIPVWGFDR